MSGEIEKSLSGLEKAAILLCSWVRKQLPLSTATFPKKTRICCCGIKAVVFAGP